MPRNFPAYPSLTVMRAGGGNTTYNVPTGYFAVLPGSGGKPLATAPTEAEALLKALRGMDTGETIAISGGKFVGVRSVAAHIATIGS